jgi:hypothetical protein
MAFKRIESHYNDILKDHRIERTAGNGKTYFNNEIRSRLREIIGVGSELFLRQQMSQLSTSMGLQSIQRFPS